MENIIAEMIRKRKFYQFHAVLGMFRKRTML
jgi:hypothetical protein